MANNDKLIKTCISALVLTIATSAAAVTNATTPVHMYSDARVSAPAKAENADETQYETLFYEDFSKWSAGTPDEPDGTMYPLKYFDDYDNTLPSDMFINEGEHNGVGCYQAGGCIALNYPSMGGYINFPASAMNGKLVLTARVKALGEKTTMFSINILTGDLDNPQSVENDGGIAGMMNITSADGWIDIRREIINSYATPCWLQINAMMYNPTGIVVDYVKIERDLTYLTAPSSASATRFTNNGFTAQWQANPNADTYLLSLYQKTPLSTQDNQAYEDFENTKKDEITGEIALSNGWSGTFGFSMDGNIATATETPDDVFEGQQAIRLHNNDRLSLFIDNTIIKDISMAFYTNAADKNTSDLKVIPYTKYNPGDNDYGYYMMLRPSKLDDGWNWVQFSEFFEDFKGGFTRVDLIPEGLNMGEYMIIDNLCGITEPLTETTCMIEDKTLTETSYTFNDLDMSKTYFFTVKQKNSNCTSEASEDIYAIGVGAPVVKEATDLDKRGAFTANWEPAVNATSYTLNCYESSIVTEAEPDRKVFVEDFSKAEGGTDGAFVSLENIDYIYLDTYADNEGWIGSGTLIGDGMVGCYTMTAEGQAIPFDMLTPAIDLSQDNGKFKVNLDFILQNEGDILVVQCDESNYIGIEGAIPNQLTHATVELEKGTANSKLMFYAYENSPFMLDKVEITQNYAAGDEILTLVSSQEVEDGASASQRISGLERKDNITYVYQLISHRDRYGMTYSSEPSEKMRVDLYDSGVNDLMPKENGNLQIFDLEGRQINGTPEPGIYIVRKNGKTIKTVVK